MCSVQNLSTSRIEVGPVKFEYGLFANVTAPFAFDIHSITL
jgi:hypothetical protein